MDNEHSVTDYSRSTRQGNNVNTTHTREHVEDDDDFYYEDYEYTEDLLQHATDMEIAYFSQLTGACILIMYHAFFTYSANPDSCHLPTPTVHDGCMGAESSGDAPEGLDSGRTRKDTHPSSPSLSELKETARLSEIRE